MELTCRASMASCSSLRSLFFVLGCAVAATFVSRAHAASSDNDDDATEAKNGKASGHDQAEKDSASVDSDEDEEVATNVPEKRTVHAKGGAGHGHKGQFNVRLGLGAAYRIVMRYDESPLCSTARNDDGTPVKTCGFGSPAMLDVAAGYGLTNGFEPFLWGRFGLSRESNTNTAPLVILGAGARLYTMSDDAFKFFVEPAVGFELEKASPEVYGNMYEYKSDLILRLALGPQYDFSRNVGVYAAGGLAAGMFRAIQTWLDLSVGVQARFP